MTERGMMRTKSVVGLQNARTVYGMRRDLVGKMRRGVMPEPVHVPEDVEL